MFITMQCGGMPFNGNTIKERSLGGSETAAYYVAKELAARGHRVSIFTNHPEEGEWDNVKYFYSGEISDQAPLGSRFHFYAENTPCDVLLVQRHPSAFSHKFSSKINILWLHDLATKNFAELIGKSQMNVATYLTVSEYHKKQVGEIYPLNPDVITPVTNGVDPLIYRDQIHEVPDLPNDKKLLIYSSRPERGLENLVKPGGIMHRLHQEGHTDFHLVVCGYDNTTPQMEAYYNQLWDACRVLPNVTNVGALTKPELANLQKQAWIHVYPTEFLEVSCITAMECMTAGLPFLASDCGALSETCKPAGIGCELVPLKDGKADEQAFFDFIIQLTEKGRKQRSEAQLKAAPYYTWAKAAERIENSFTEVFSRATDSAKLKHLIRHSDIFAAKTLLATIDEDNPIVDQCAKELDLLYNFTETPLAYSAHYNNMYKDRDEKGIYHGPEELDGNTRFETVAAKLAELPDGASVLDYGCAHGHYTINLARRFPNLYFTGIDIAEPNIEKAQKWVDDEELDNVEFIKGELHSIQTKHDAIILAEVLEHVVEPNLYIDVLHSKLTDDGILIITTPFGPWEAMSFKDEYPWRQHLWHFERADIWDMLGDFQDLQIQCIPMGKTPQGENLGSYVYSIKKTSGILSSTIDMHRKLETISPRETISQCMIVKDCEETLLRALRSIRDVVDEIVIGVDPSSDGQTLDVIDSFIAENDINDPKVIEFQLEKPVIKSGFSEARNQVINKASGNWIMWLDSDEVLDQGQKLSSYTKANGLNGIITPQHHFALEPLGVLKTDFPCKLFRNHKGIQFTGVVHEHPESELNKGVGHSLICSEVNIAHSGYQNEEIRRNRFNRNFPLMVRDREEWPDRHLGKFLWMRDMSQMCGYEMSKNGGQVTPQIKEWAESGIAMWKDLIEAKQYALLKDGIEFRNPLVHILGGSLEVSFQIDASTQVQTTDSTRAKPMTALFFNEEEAQNFINLLLHEKVKSNV